MTKRELPATQTDLFSRSAGRGDIPEQLPEFGTSAARVPADGILPPVDDGKARTGEAVVAAASGSPNPVPTAALTAAARDLTPGGMPAPGGAAAGRRVPGRRKQAVARSADAEASLPKATAAISGVLAYEDARYLSVQRVARRYDTSIATIWRWVSKGQFPAPRRITTGTTRWFIADLEAFDVTLGSR